MARQISAKRLGDSFASSMSQELGPSEGCRAKHRLLDGQQRRDPREPHAARQPGFVPAPGVAPTSLPSLMTGGLAATTSFLAPAAAQAQEAAEATINPRDAIVQAFALTFVSVP